jgi:hypothetical protein
MHLYKYRDLSVLENSFERLSDILRTNTFWCASPSKLNDPEEFMWECDYDPSDQTARLLAEVLIKLGRPTGIAWEVASKAVEHVRIEPIARPIIEKIIDRCRQEVGLACFATSDASDVMWGRYGGKGNGVCVEVEVPNKLLHTDLHPVQYPLSKRLHVDRILASYGDTSSAQTVYSVALLSKPQCWASEEEVRFVSKRQNVSVNIVGSKISRIVLGADLANGMTARIEALAKSLPYDLPIAKRIG